MKSNTFKVAMLATGLFLAAGTLKAQPFSEAFNDITTLPGSGWVMTNASAAVGSTNWFQGNVIGAGGPFDAYNGAANAYIAANYNNTGSIGTISNWLLTPTRTFRNGDVITFYTRKASPDTYADRLEVRLSTNGASTNVGSGTTVGDYTTLLLSVNPSLVLGVYPVNWTAYTITISGLTAPTSGRIGFRYFVTSAGLSGTNSDYIGIDQVNYTPYVCPSFTLTAAGALTSGTAGSEYSASISQTGALGTPSFSVTAGALPAGLSLSSSGTISGTPTQTGTFNFTVTAGDASGCSGSQSYSITVSCPANPISMTAVSSASLCSMDSLYTLEATPAGGTFSGTGVSGTMFDPSAGTQTITYDYTDVYGCAHFSNATITVNTNPVVTIPSYGPFCMNENEFELTGALPAGGTYSGTGMNDSIFDPLAGTQTVTYFYTDANGCSGSASTVITINDVPVVTQSQPDDLCSNGSPVVLSGGSPEGGEYIGTGVTNGMFNPSAGTQPVTYMYIDSNGCSGSASVLVTVNDAPSVTLALAQDEFCVYNASATLSGGSPAGGSFSGSGVAGGTFNPANAGTGSHTISYMFTDENGCAGTATDMIMVDECLGIGENAATVITVSPNPSAGIFVISGLSASATVTDINGKFMASSVAAGNGDQLVDLTDAAPGIYLLVSGNRAIRIVKI